ncbi:MAG: T9SS type A sorting domain-containing protein [Bacteroidia bacterium]|nr:T9SS type A sorting domain-containing protein [Bacteroidia bacterium]
MMKRSQPITKVILMFCLVSFGLGSVVAQENTDAMGGMLYGPAGTVSYSIGQIDYETATGSGGNITEGLQQPYEIMILSGIEENDINLTFSLFPNPTADLVVLSVQNSVPLNLTCSLFNIEGKLIEKREVNSSQTTITMSDLANGAYLLKVLRKSTEVKIFKIIKNN